MTVVGVILLVAGILIHFMKADPTTESGIDWLTLSLLLIGIGLTLSIVGLALGG